MRETHILETKNVGLYTWRGRGRGSEKVYCLYTHENVDIFGWPLSEVILYHFLNMCLLAVHVKRLQSIQLTR